MMALVTGFAPISLRAAKCTANSAHAIQQIEIFITAKLWSQETSLELDFLLRLLWLKS